MKSVLYRHTVPCLVFLWNKGLWGSLLFFCFAVACPGAETLDSQAKRAHDESAPETVRQAQMVSSAFRETSRKVIPSVVKVVVRRNSTAQNADNKDKKKPLLPFGDFLPETPEDEAIEGVGSGVLVDPSGIVLTNNHVVAQSGGANITVELDDGRRVKVNSLKKDEQSDLAVLTLEEKGGYPYLKFGNSDQLEIGDWVLAIGNPFMLESSVSAGIVSAKHRLLGKKGHGTYIQTDAAVNPGNSGGPLVNLKGEIIGINTAIASLSGGNQGIGFAIPSNTALWVMNQLMKTGKVSRAFLGAAVERIGYEEGRKYGLAPRQGVRIATLYKDTPATRAGLRNNDLILAFDGIDINSREALETMIESAD
ncbi:MAG: trypsin-like peptidase domain-containing protein, partial [Planctomycetia bacterium]|nr:trypsin-like peptidase domain-containing protein [Planctomycetia bacterium]